MALRLHVASSAILWPLEVITALVLAKQLLPVLFAIILPLIVALLALTLRMPSGTEFPVMVLLVMVICALITDIIPSSFAEFPEIVLLVMVALEPDPLTSIAPISPAEFPEIVVLFTMRAPGASTLIAPVLPKASAILSVIALLLIVRLRPALPTPALYRIPPAMPDEFFEIVLLVMTALPTPKMLIMPPACVELEFSEIVLFSIVSVGPFDPLKTPL